jgi:hypothetical protein
VRSRVSAARWPRRAPALELDPRDLRPRPHARDQLDERRGAGAQAGRLRDLLHLRARGEVAAVLRITPKTVHQHIRRVRLRAIRSDGAGLIHSGAPTDQAWAESQL